MANGIRRCFRLGRENAALVRSKRKLRAAFFTRNNTGCKFVVFKFVPWLGRHRNVFSS